MLKKIKFKGGFFNEEKELKLFMNEDRISVLYGKNGSGRSEEHTSELQSQR